MPGGGLTEKNIGRVVKRVPFAEVHASLRTKVDSAMEFRNFSCFVVIACHDNFTDGR